MLLLQDDLNAELVAKNSDLSRCINLLSSLDSLRSLWGAGNGGSEHVPSPASLGSFVVPQTLKHTAPLNSHDDSLTNITGLIAEIKNLVTPDTGRLQLPATSATSSAAAAARPVSATDAE